MSASVLVGYTTPAGYSVVVLGAPLYMFRWHKDARHFLSRHREALTQRPVAIFALGPFTTGDEKEWQGSREQLNKELAGFPWLTPVALEIFGAASSTRQSYASLTIYSCARCRQATCGTGRRSAPGRAA